MKALLSIAALAIAIAPSLADTVVYRLADKQVGEDAPWSGKDVKLRLSPGSGGEMKFELADLPEHKFVKLELDFEISDGGSFVSMMGGGNASTESSDRLQIMTADGRTLLDSSFSSMKLGQSFPDAFGSFLHAPGTGAKKPKKIQGLPAGFNFPGLGGSGSYSLELIFPHEGSDLALDFDWEKAAAAGGAAGNFAIQINGRGIGGSGGDGPYSISDLRVSTIEAEAAKVDAAKAMDLLDDISDTDPAKAHKAVQELIATGDSCLPFIRKRFEREIDPELEAKLDKLTVGLRSDDFKERSAAEVALADLGPDSIPLLAKILSKPDDLTVDVRTGLEKVKRRLEKSSAASPDQTLANRLRPALDIIASEQSKEVAKLLPSLKKIELYETPEQGKGGAMNLLNGALKMQIAPGGDDKDE